MMDAVSGRRELRQPLQRWSTIQDIEDLCELSFLFVYLYHAAAIGVVVVIAVVAVLCIKYSRELNASVHFLTPSNPRTKSEEGFTVFTVHCLLFAFQHRVCLWMADELANSNIYILTTLFARIGCSSFLSAMKERDKRWLGIAEC